MHAGWINALLPTHNIQFVRTLAKVGRGHIWHASKSIFNALYSVYMVVRVAQTIIL